MSESRRKPPYTVQGVRCPDGTIKYFLLDLETTITDEGCTLTVKLNELPMKYDDKVWRSMRAALALKLHRLPSEIDEMPLQDVQDVYDISNRLGGAN